MADKKITELSSVSTLPDGAVFTAVDSTRSAGDQNVQISKADLAADIGGGGGLPNGGNQNDELIKQSGTDGDANWYKKSYLNVKVYGAKGDAIQLQDGAITSASANFSSASATFTSDDVGKVMHIEGAGASGGYLTTTIATFTDANNVVLTDNANTTVASAVSLYGTDDTSAIQDTINAADAQLGGTVYLPNGVYIINGDLQNNVGSDSIDYNSQLYIPKRQRGVNDGYSTIWIEGESSPFQAQSAGIGLAIPQIAGTVLVSTIQGSGTTPAMICSRSFGSSVSNPNQYFNYTTTGLKNLNIQLTPNENNKLTMGGAELFQSIISFVEHVTIFPYNLNLVNGGEPDVININGLSCQALNCSVGGYINQLSVGGFTNGLKIGEHCTIQYFQSRTCVNGVLLTNSFNSSTFLDVGMFWCKNNIAIDTSVAGFSQEGRAYFAAAKSEVINTGKWYDYEYFLNDPSQEFYGTINYIVLRASLGVDNNYFIINGGENSVCRPFSVARDRIFTSGETLELKHFGALLNKYTGNSNALIDIPEFDATSTPPYTPQEGQKTVYNIRSETGNLNFNALGTVSIETIPPNYTSSNGKGSVVELTYLGSNTYALKGDLQEKIIPANLIRYIKYNNSVVDITNNSTPTSSGLTYNVSGKINQSGDYSGSTARVRFSDSADLSFGNGTTDLPFSFEGWFKFDTVSSSQLLLGKRDTVSNDEYQIGYSSSTNSLFMVLYSGGTSANRLDLRGSTTLSTGVWYHIAYTYDGSSSISGLKIYLNGVEESYTDNSLGTYVAMQDGTSDAQLGLAPWDNSSLAFSGEMDESRIWSKELNSTEINDLVTDGNNGDEIA